MKKYTRGFTIIDLMIVVAIIGLLSSVAIPNYSEYVLNSKRGYAQESMMELAVNLQRVRNKTFSFVNGVSMNEPTAAVGPNTISYRGSVIYNLTVPQVNANTFTIQATPQNGMANNGPMQLIYINGQLQGTWDDDNNGSFTEIWR